MTGRLTHRTRAPSSLVVACLLASPLASSDQVISDDLIVDQSLCVGLDCVDGESFGFDTILLKEHNLRIKFEDTSSTGDFTTNDWQITINESANGGLEKFSIDDVTGNSTPLTIEAGAPTDSLYVDADGDIGLGTNQPAADIHSQSGNTPTLRLEQDTSNGWSQQIWDVAGNETNFFIRDVSNGSKLPFKILPDAPNNALYIASSGYVGFGKNAPEKHLHIVSGDGEDPATIRLSTVHADSWDISGEPNSFIISQEDTLALKIDDSGDLTVAGNININSDERLKTAIESIGAAMDIINTLDGKSYLWRNPKSNDAPQMGFLAQDVEAVLPQLVSEANDGTKSVNYLGVIPILVNALKEQKEAADKQQAEIERLSTELSIQRELLQTLISER